MNRRMLIIFVAIFCLIAGGFGAVSGMAMPAQNPPCHQAKESKSAALPCCQPGTICKCCPGIMAVLPPPLQVAVLRAGFRMEAPLLPSLMAPPRHIDPPPRAMM